jgi:hypothetical protein
MTHQTEPCVSCGEDTSAGSPFFSDRLVDRTNGEARFMCSLCVQLARGSREFHPMTDEERVKLEKAAFAFGSFAPGGH